MQTIEDIYAAIVERNSRYTGVGILTRIYVTSGNSWWAARKEPVTSAQTRIFAKQGRLVPGFPLWLSIRLIAATRFRNLFGYVTKNRGVSVHRTDCKNAKSLLLSEERKISVEWIEGNIGSYLVYITILAHERKGILSDISRALFNANVDIKYIKADTDESGKYATIKLAFEVEDSFRLRFIMTMLRGIESVIDVFRGRLILNTPQAANIIRFQNNSYRTVVHKRYLHIRAELSALNIYLLA